MYRWPAAPLAGRPGKEWEVMLRYPLNQRGIPADGAAGQQ